MADQSITLRLRADGSELSAAASKASSDIKSIGAAAESASRQADQLGESEEQAAARIRDVVRASGEAKSALGGVAESQRSVAERGREAAQAATQQASAYDSIATTQAQMRAQVDALNAAEERQARAAKAAGAAAKGEAGDLTDLLGRIDPVVKKLGELDVLESRLRAARKAGKIGGEDYDTYLAKLERTRKSLSDVEGGVHKFSLANAGAVRELGVLAGEMSRGDFDRFGSSLLVLANRTNSLPALFTGVGAAIGGVLVVVGLLGAAYLKGAEESAALNRALTSTGNIAGTTAGQVEVMAQRIGAIDGRAGEARAALTQLIATGKITGDSLENAARAAKAFADVTGGELAEGVKEIAKLADDPSKGVLELNEKFHFLTATVFEHIHALQQQGDQEGATAAAMKAAADALEDRRATIVENAGYIERAWTSAKNAVSGFVDSLASIGRDSTVDEQIAGIKNELQGIDELRAKYAKGGFLASIGSALGATDRLDTRSEGLIAQLKALEDTKSATDALAKSQADQQKVQDAGARAYADQAKALTDNASKQEKLAAAVAQVHAQFEKIRASGVTEINGLSLVDAEQKRIEQLNQQYREHTVAATTRASLMQRISELQEKLATIDDSASNSLDALTKETNRYNAELRSIGSTEAQLVLDMQKAKLGLEAEASAHADANAARERAAQTHQANADAIKREQAAIVSKLASDARYEQSLLRMTDRERAVAEAQRHATEYYKQNEAAFKAQGVTLEQLTAQQAKAAGVTFDLAEQAANLNQVLSQFGEVDPFTKLVESIKQVGEELTTATDPKRVEALQRALGNMRQSMVVGVVQTSQEALRGIQSLTEEGSRSFQALQIAIDALTVVQGIAAIVNQGMGDPYTAIPRMIAMAAMIAKLGVNIKGFTGGGSNPAHSAEYRQALQGTGSVLGDEKAKSESIAKATEITANATEQLVGINRGMLDALRSLQRALGAAGNQLARGAANAEFPGLQDSTRGLLGLDPLGSALTSDPIGGAIGSFLWGGSQKVIDQGIQIAGGRLTDMLNSIVVGAYQTVKTDGGLFGSDSTKDQFGAVSADFSRQFQLVIGSIVDTVREGAKALGVLPADVEAAIAAYNVEATKISLEGLSAEDQQKALEAVFSKIFDGLAGAVVPFIDQFQKVGEGLGETLVRVATEVQVTQEAFKQLGIAVAETDPEKFAQIADGLVEATGGIDAFISGLNSFVSKFSSDAHQLDVNSQALVSAFGQANLTLPQTREGMLALMQSLDATTEQGREQIATLLRLSDVADQYYSQLDAFSKQLGLSQSGELKRQLTSIHDSAVALSQALQRAGASSDQLQRIATAAFDRMREAIEAVRSAAQESAFELGLTNAGSLDQVNAEVDRLKGIADAAKGSMHGFGSAIEDAANRARDAINLLLGDKSPLNDQRKLEVARQGLVAGTVTQDQFLEIARRLYATTSQFTREFEFAQRYPGAGQARSPGGGGGGSPGLTGEQQARLTDLLKQQQELQAQSDLVRYRELAQQYAQLADVDKKSFIDELKGAGIDLTKFAQGLGLQGEEALKAYGDNLKAQIEAQGNGAASIVDAIRELGDRITGVDTTPVNAGSPIDNPGTHAGGHDLPIAQDPRGHGGRGLPTVDEGSSPAAANGAALATKAAKASQDSADELKAMRALLQALVEEARKGSPDVVAAVAGTTDEVRQLGSAAGGRALEQRIKERR
ncbi:phage-related minor tail protein [Dokdonella fugitiva]|uniref:Phage-related minor tail protein n=1 Tax=Dokdonella fugitiva TaxID=328517 RepID=A0A839EQY5_9GAMM|nr:phage tail length tape measure family protein [Dokdonella fugitiva]MBA8886165.1 phage-related minor tail protein [Dokdonella fugitiva]